MMAAPVRALENAVVALLAEFGAARVIGHRAVDWASATFVGARHEIEAMLAPAPHAAGDAPISEAIAARLADAEAVLPGHLLADMILADHAATDNELRLAIEALTLIDG